MLQVGELDVDDGLDDAILGRDPGVCFGGAAVVCEQVVDAPDNCREVWAGVDGVIFRVVDVGDANTRRFKVSGDFVDGWWCGVESVVGEW